MAKDTFFNATKSITLCGVEYNLDQPRIMGILNLTPDSFYDGGRYKNEAEIIGKTQKMLDEGAWVIDIGGCSSRPGGELISEEEEIKRVVPVVKLLVEKFPKILISIDTFRVNVAEKALSAGACMINDISAGRWNNSIFEVLNKYQAGYIMMHSRGKFEEMHLPYSYDDLIFEVSSELEKSMVQAENNLFTNYIIDPGFGFSKNIEQNFEMLSKLSEFTKYNCPLLCGISRKSFIWKTLETNPEGALNGTTALHLHCLQNGANILRVHDVKEAKEVIDLFLKLA